MERKKTWFHLQTWGDKLGYGWLERLRRLWRCGVFSALFKVMIRQPFFHHARRHRPTLLLCFFKSLANWPNGVARSQDFMQPLPYWAVSHQRSCCSVCIWFPGRKIAWDVWLHMIPGSVNDEDVTTYQERLGSYLKKMLRRIKSVLEVTRRRYDVSRASWKLLEENVATYQERLGSYCTWRKCYDVSGASWKLLEEDVTTYQERLGSYLKIVEEGVAT